MIEYFWCHFKVQTQIFGSNMNLNPLIQSGPVGYTISLPYSPSQSACRRLVPSSCVAAHQHCYNGTQWVYVNHVTTDEMIAWPKWDVLLCQYPASHTCSQIHATPHWPVMCIYKWQNSPIIRYISPSNLLFLLPDPTTYRPWSVNEMSKASKDERMGAWMNLWKCQEFV